MLDKSHVDLPPDSIGFDWRVRPRGLIGGRSARDRRFIFQTLDALAPSRERRKERTKITTYSILSPISRSLCSLYYHRDHLFPHHPLSIITSLFSFPSHCRTSSRPGEPVIGCNLWTDPCFKLHPPPAQRVQTLRARVKKIRLRSLHTPPRFVVWDLR